MERGKIRSTDNAGQIRDFSGLRYGKITPTDIDGLMDFGNNIFILFELKYGHNPMARGQQLAIERVVDNLQNAGKIAIGIVAEHNTTFESQIDCANCVVVQKRMFKKWHLQSNHITLKQAIDLTLQRYAPEYFNHDNLR